MGKWDDYVIEEHQIKKKYARRYDRSGEVYNHWTILSIADWSKDTYHVKCSCGVEYIRNMKDILQSRSTKCFRCSKKMSSFKRNY